MTITQMLFLMASGVGAGLIGSLFGLGGGILIVPVLALALKVPMHNAIATSLLCVIATSSAAASQNIRSGVANVRLGTVLEPWTVLGAIAGSSLAGVMSGRALMIVFGVAMGAMAFPMARGVPDEARSEEPETEEGETEAGVRGSPSGPLALSLSRFLDGSYYDPAAQTVVSYRVRRLPLSMGVSVFAGILSGLLGVGGGIVKVPAMSLWSDVPMKAAAATSNFMIGVTAAASAIIYYGRSDVAPLISAASVIGVFAGSRAGAHLAPLLHGQHLRRAFAVVMVVVSVQMLWRGLW